MSAAVYCVKRYFTEPTLYVLKTRVQSVGSDEKGKFARLVETIFHPQGGGQPFDLGSIGAFKVIRVEKEGSPTVFDIKHYYEGDGELKEGDEVECNIDIDRRKMHARLHSAGHLIAAIMEEKFPSIKAISGHHVPKECRVEFAGEMPLVTEAIKTLTEELPKAIAANWPVKIAFTSDETRTIQIGEYPAVGCGGTHVSSLSELDGIKIKSVNIKSSKLRVSYE